MMPGKKEKNVCKTTTKKVMVGKKEHTHTKIVREIKTRTKQNYFRD